MRHQLRSRIKRPVPFASWTAACTLDDQLTILRHRPGSTRGTNALACLAAVEGGTALPLARAPGPLPAPAPASGSWQGTMPPGPAASLRFRDSHTARPAPHDSSGLLRLTPPVRWTRIDTLSTHNDPPEAIATVMTATPRLVRPGVKIATSWATVDQTARSAKRQRTN
jgi:hypothetical protein